MAGTPTGLVLALLGEFASDMREARSINQLALSSGKAYANVHAATTALLNERILIKETIGRSHLCRLNLENDKTLLYLSLLQTVKRDDLLRKDAHALELLRALDDAGPRMGLLLAWHREEDILLITAQDTALQIPTRPARAVRVMHLQQFLDDEGLRSTIGRHTLLFGHALYASLLRERARHDSIEVRQ